VWDMRFQSNMRITFVRIALPSCRNGTWIAVVAMAKDGSGLNSSRDCMWLTPLVVHASRTSVNQNLCACDGQR